MRSLIAAPVDPAVVAALVLFAALMHAIWNGLIKGSSDQVGTQAVLMFSGGVLAAAVVPFVPVPAREAWPYLAVSVVVHTIYRTFLVWAYRHGDLSSVYPLARGLAPVLVALAAMQLEGESLNRYEVAGVILVSVGIASLAFEKWNAVRSHRLPVVLALATGLLVSTYSTIDGMGGRRAVSALGYAAWLLMLEPIPFVGAVAFLRRRRLVETWRANKRAGVVGGVISTVGYAIVIWALSVGGMAQVIALRETSVIAAALIGIFMFKESSGSRRVLAAVLVVAGNLLLQLF